MPLTVEQKQHKLQLLRKKHGSGMRRVQVTQDEPTGPTPLGGLSELDSQFGELGAIPDATSSTNVGLPSEIDLITQGVRERGGALLGDRPTTMGDTGKQLLSSFVAGLTGVPPDPLGISPFEKFVNTGGAPEGASKVVGELGGEVGLFALIGGGARVGGSIVKRMLTRLVRGGTIGGAFEARRQAGDPEKEFSAKNIGISAAEFAAFEVGLAGLGAVGKKIKGFLEKRKFADAKKLFDELPALEGQAEFDAKIRSDVEAFIGRGAETPLLPAPKGRGEGFTFRDKLITDDPAILSANRAELLGQSGPKPPKIGPLGGTETAAKGGPSPLREVFIDSKKSSGATGSLKHNLDNLERGAKQHEPSSVTPKPSGGVKEPFEMTADEFALSVPVRPLGKGEISATFPDGSRFRFRDSPKEIDKVAFARRRVVQMAISEGKTVPPEVLKDFPDLIPPKPTVKPSGDITLGFLGASPDDFARLGKNVTGGIESVAGKITPNSIKQVKNRLVEPPAKEIGDRVLRADEDHHLLVGQWLERINKDTKTKLMKMSDKEAIAFADAIEAGEGGVVTDITNEILEELRATGVELGGIKNYFRRQLKKDVAEELFNDLSKIDKRFAGANSATEEEIINAIKGVGKRTKKILDAIVSKGKAKSYRDAVDMLHQTASHQLFPGASFTKRRTLDFTDLEDLIGQIYERNAKTVVVKYINDASKHIAMAKNFGGVRVEGGKFIVDGEAQRLLSEIVSSDERGVAETLLQMYSGQYDRLHGFKTQGARNFVDAFIGFEFVTKIAGGLATIPNASQTLISTYFQLGGMATFEGLLKSFTPKGRAFARKSGIFNQNLLHATIGYETGGLLNKFVDQAGKISGFTGINKVNIMVAANAAEASIRRFYRVANKGGLGSNRAKTRLADFGVDWQKPLTDDVLLKKMFRFAQDAQLQKNFLNDIAFMNTKEGKFLGLFKRFGIKQFTITKDVIWREVKRGNPMPILRLAAGGYFGGEFVIWSKNKIKSFLSGESVYRDEDFASWERFINNVSAVGSLGMFSDVAGSLFEAVGSKSREDALAFGRSVLFQATPVVVSDASTLAEVSLLQALPDMIEYDIKTSARRNIPKLGRLFGSHANNIGKRFLTEDQKTRRAKQKWGKARTSVQDAFIEGDSDKGVRLWIAWNENNLDNPIPLDSVANIGALITRAEKKAKRQIEVRR